MRAECHLALSQVDMSLITSFVVLSVRARRHISKHFNAALNGAKLFSAFRVRSKASGSSDTRKRLQFIKEIRARVHCIRPRRALQRNLKCRKSVRNRNVMSLRMVNRLLQMAYGNTAISASMRLISVKLHGFGFCARGFCHHYKPFGCAAV